MPASLTERDIAECAATTSREAVRCALRWREGWQQSESDKAAARALWAAPEAVP